ncbi:MAG: alpha/beta hydrolase [Anaerovoracaceae bacterium]
MSERENGGYSRAAVVMLFIVICAIFVFTYLSAQHSDEVKESRFRGTRTPTLLIPQRGGSGKKFSSMTRRMKSEDVTNTVKTAVVEKDGTVDLSSTMKRTLRNPVIIVRFEDSSQKDWHRRAYYLKSLVSYLGRTYGYKDFNAVGYDEGAVTTTYYLLDYGRRKDLPHLRTFISIAGDYDRLADDPKSARYNRFEPNGRPAFTDSTYYELLSLRDKKPAYKIDVLNIYGRKNSKASSDGVTSVMSARSLSYLVEPFSASYREKRITGGDGKHSNIVSCDRTVNAVIRTLWKKPDDQRGNKNDKG